MFCKFDTKLKYTTGENVLCYLWLLSLHMRDPWNYDKPITRNYLNQAYENFEGSKSSSYSCRKMLQIWKKGKNHGYRYMLKDMTRILLNSYALVAKISGYFKLPVKAHDIAINLHNFQYKRWDITTRMFVISCFLRLVWDILFFIYFFISPRHCNFFPNALFLWLLNVWIKIEQHC